jgi:hypothetical protein
MAANVKGTMTMEKIVLEYKRGRITVRSKEQGFYAYLKKLDQPIKGEGESKGCDFVFGPYDDAEMALSMAKAAMDV